MNTKNNTILITGGASGIGYALAGEFLSLGNTVIACGRNSVKLDNMRKTHPEIHTVRCDITKMDDLLKMLNYIQERFPQLNVIINNAGIQYNYSFFKDDNTLEKIKEEIDVNLSAPVNLTKFFLDLISKNDNPAIINISSPLALVPKKSAPLYCATKAGLHTFSDSLRYQLEDTPIKVIEVMPPLVDTDMTRGRGKGKITAEEFARKLIKELARDKERINIGKTKLLFAINRISPGVASLILKNG